MAQPPPAAAPEPPEAEQAPAPSEGSTGSAPGTEAGDERPLPPEFRITYSDLTAVRLNPLGLETRPLIGFERRLWKDPGILTRDAYIGFKLAPYLNPALARLGAMVEVKPAAVFALRAGAFFKNWFGTFGQLDAYDSPRAEHCDQCMLDRGDQGLTVGVATAFEAELGALAQIKVGPIAVRHDAAFYYQDAKIPGNTVFYDSRLDMVVPDGGVSTTQETDVLYVTDFGLAAGARFSALHAFYRDSDYRAGESVENDNTPAMRLGPAVAYTFFEDPGAAFDKPTLIFLSQWWLQHRYRTGEDISQAIPYVAIAFRFEGQLWGSEN
jgi:hypothetical protein